MSQKLILPINNTKLTASIDTQAYYTRFGFRHCGCDTISTRGDTTIYASGNGTVMATGYDNACGNVVAVVYPLALNRATGKIADITFRYLHLDSISVQEGQVVTKDTVIGRYGHTGTYAGTGAHLHLEADLDTTHVLYTPTVVASNYLKGTSQGAYAFDSPQNTVLNPLDLLHRKADAPDSQTYTTAGDAYIRDSDKTIATVTSDTQAVDTQTRIEGIDVSKNNGVIDWSQVKAAGKDFVFIKLGNAGFDGGLQNWDKGVDTRFAANIQGALAAGLHVGVYVYSYAKTPGAAAAAARETLELVKPYRLTYPIVFDMESISQTEPGGALYDRNTPSDNSAIAAAFLAEIIGGGYYGMLYTYKSFAESYLDMSALAAYEVWIAQYAKTCTYGGAYGIWQYMGDVPGFVGSCPGVTGACDLDVAYRDYASVVAAGGWNGLEVSDKGGGGGPDTGADTGPGAAGGTDELETLRAENRQLKEDLAAILGTVSKYQA